MYIKKNKAKTKPCNKNKLEKKLITKQNAMTLRVEAMSNPFVPPPGPDPLVPVAESCGGWSEIHAHNE